MMRRYPLLLLAYFAVLAGCTSSTEGKRVGSITLSPSPHTFSAFTATQAFTATVLDQDGGPMTGVTLTWSSTALGVVQVNNVGLATAVGNGTAKVRATAGGVTGEVDITVDQSPIAFGYAPTGSGNGLSSTRGQPVAVKPGVVVTDANGIGIAGEVVTFSVLSGGGSIGVADATTDASGTARVSSWTLGPNLGDNTLQAAYPGFAPVVFTVTGIEDPCTPAGAVVIALGDSKNGSLASSDCLLGNGKRYDLYALTLASPSGVVLMMDAVTHDAYLQLLAADNTTILAENDDIVLGVNTDSRIGMQLAAGTYYIRATSFDPGEIGNYSLTASVAAVGVPATVEVSAGQGQVVAPGVAVPIAPAVIVKDDLGDPVAGAQVDFAIVVGSQTGASVVTGANGIATVGSWTLAAGANVMSATVTGLASSPVIFSASGNASTAGFNVSVRFSSMPTATQLSAFSSAAQKWESVITSDLVALPLNLPAATCSTSPAINETVDDVLIFALLEPIDGPNAVLGSAGPCLVRSGSAMPVVGVMRFDTADLPALEGAGNFSTVILHEMGHVLGIGTLWDYSPIGRDFLQNPSLPSASGANTHMNGANAVTGFNAIGGATWTGSTTPLATSKVPVENTQGGSGTRDSHWRESVLANELMTGFLGGGANPLSELTVRSLVDIGYTVNVAQADPFFLSLSLRDANTPVTPLVELKNDILRLPILEVDLNGRVRKPPKGAK